MVYIYILQCSDKSLYTGITHNIPVRIAQHFKGRCRYTRSRLPVSLIHVEVRETRKEAAKFERFLKDFGAKKYLLREFAAINKNIVFL